MGRSRVKLLLDTHIWLWSLIEPKRLPKRIARELRSAKSQLWLSPISVWEAHLLIEAGRLRVEGDPKRWLTQSLEASSLTEARLTHEVALASREIVLEHHDPADRFLAATAQIYDLVLATADERLLAGSGFRSLGE